MSIRYAPILDVFLDGKLSSYSRILNVRYGCGEGDFCVAQFELRALWQTPKKNVELRDWVVNKRCDIRLNETFDTRKPVWIHRGKVCAAELSIDSDGENVVVTSRLDHDLLGGPAADVRIVDLTTPSSGVEKRILSVNADMVFNPTMEVRRRARLEMFFDELPTPNMFFAGLPKQSYCFVMPESVDRDILNEDRQNGLAKPLDDRVGQVARFWNPSTVVHYLFQTHNGLDGSFAQNPPFAYIVSMLGTDSRLIRDLKLQIGQTLPEMLDAVLTPLGFGWYIDLETMQFRFHQRGLSPNGPFREFKLQPLGEVVNTEHTNVHAVNVDIDISRRGANKVVVFGDYAYLEGTFELVPGWPSKYDNTDFALLDSKSLADNVSADSVLRRIYRYYVLNETGEYSDAKNLVNPFDVDEFFGEPHARMRRRFYPMLTRGKDGRDISNFHGCYLEWKVVSDIDWRPWSQFATQGNDASGLPREGLQLLTDECGIAWLGGPTPPTKIAAKFQGNNGRQKMQIRITACLKTDVRHSVFSAGIGDGTLLSDVRQIHIVDERYRLAKLNPTERANASRFYDGVIAKTYTAAVADDRPAMQARANLILADVNRGAVSGSITLTGIDWDLHDSLGDQVTKLAGREIGFNPLPRAGRKKAGPWISAVSWNIQAQTTVVELEQQPIRLRI